LTVPPADQPPLVAPQESNWTSLRTLTSLGTLVGTAPGTLVVVVDDDDDGEFELLHAASVTPKTDAAAKPESRRHLLIPALHLPLAGTGDATHGHSIHGVIPPCGHLSPDLIGPVLAGASRRDSLQSRGALPPFVH
jgi:hypothetical protein